MQTQTDAHIQATVCIESMSHSSILSMPQETRRAGEHLITTDALQSLQWELHGAALLVLQQVASLANAGTSSVDVDGNNCNSISEKGVLQLLFDQRLLRSVIGGGKPPGATAAGVGVETVEQQVAARKRLVVSVEQLLQVS